MTRPYPWVAKTWADVETGRVSTSALFHGKAPQGHAGPDEAARKVWRGVTPRAAPRHLRNVEGSDAEVFEKYAEELTRFATGIVGSSDAQDVVSGGLPPLHDVQRLAGRTGPPRLPVQVRAQRGPLAPSFSRPPPPEESRAAEREGVGQGTPQPEVLQAVQRLSLRQRAVVFLNYWDDLGPAAVAELLGISEGAVRRHLTRARARLKEVLDGQH